MEVGVTMTFISLAIDPMTEEQKDIFLAILKTELDKMGLEVSGHISDDPDDLLTPKDLERNRILGFVKGSRI